MIFEHEHVNYPINYKIVNDCRVLKAFKNKGFIKIEPSKFQKHPMTIREFIDKWADKIQCSPVGQRLDTTPGPEKREGIIRSILCGIDIGEITIVENGKDEISFIEGFKYDSLDGGHRKRYTQLQENIIIFNLKN